ncbi:carboxylic ester hydrolase [Trichonephila inaurata madagascariensis]|uniref:Carboxylic ester hydrolase n=1 Tax=Trichonephila inaurata madagascariensis TaxID=2747483 RepID=A0A8X6XQL1_9ARAC|nr:carboxylic ester hydrolase [Trichonephila inaurata madagascariensis]
MCIRPELSRVGWRCTSKTYLVALSALGIPEFIRSESNAESLGSSRLSVPDIPGEITWPLYRHDKQEYLELNDEEVVRIRPDNYRCEFWRDRSRAQIDDKIYSKVRRSLMPVSSGHRWEANYLLKIASVLLVSLWTMVGFI